MVTYWDFQLLVPTYKDKGTKPHSEDPLWLRYLPEVNIPLKKAGVSVQEFLNYPVLWSFYINHSVVQQGPSALRLWGLSSEQGKVELTLWLGDTVNNNNKNNIAWCQVMTSSMKKGKQGVEAEGGWGKGRGAFRQEGKRRPPWEGRTGARGKEWAVRRSGSRERNALLMWHQRNLEHCQRERHLPLLGGKLSARFQQILQLRQSSVVEFTSPLWRGVIFLYFQFTLQAGEKCIPSPWVSLFRTIKKSYFLVIRRMTTPRFPIFSLQGGCHHSILIDPTFHP